MNKTHRGFLIVVGALTLVVSVSVRGGEFAEAKSPTTKKRSTKATKSAVKSLATLPASPALTAGDSVPFELVNDLFFDTYSTGDIVVGKLPGGFPAELPVPPNSSVLGGMTVRYGQQTGAPLNVIGVLRNPLPVSGVMSFFAKELAAAGWQQPKGPDSGGGFDTAPQSFLPWCKGSTSLTIQTRQLAQATSIKIMVVDSSGNSFAYSFCLGPPTSQQQPPPQILPKLVPPSGVELQSFGSGVSGEYASSNAQAKTAVSPADLLNHFDAQLQAAGWKLNTKLGGPVGARASYNVPFGNKTIPGTLLIISHQDGFVTLSLTRGAIDGPFGAGPTFPPAPAPVLVPAPSPQTTQIATIAPTTKPA